MLEFHGSDILAEHFPGTGAVALGNVVTHRDRGTPPAWRRTHERQHVTQAYFMGLSYMPFHLINQALHELGVPYASTPLEYGPSRGRPFF